MRKLTVNKVMEGVEGIVTRYIEGEMPGTPVDRPPDYWSKIKFKMQVRDEIGESIFKDKER